VIRGIEVLNKKVEEQIMRRFLGLADNRDFFYLARNRPSG
jgi:hypothetical protein